MQYPSSRGAVILPGLLCLAISLSASQGPNVRLERTQMEEFLLIARKGEAAVLFVPGLK